MARFDEAPGCDLDGVPLMRGVTWSQTTGTSAHIATLYVPREGLGKLIDRPRLKSVLTIDGEKWEALSVLGAAPGPNPYVGAVRVADRRYWWHYQWVRFPVNMRRAIGTKRRGVWGDDDFVPTATALQQYRPYSLDRAGNPWLPTDLLGAIIRRIDPTARFFFDSPPPAVPIEELDIDMDGESAVRRVLGALPRTAITVDPTGVVRAYDWGSTGERHIVTASGPLGPPTVAGGWVEVVDHALTRPKAVTLLATIQAEVRWDALETMEVPETAVGGSEEVVGNKTVERLLENVLPSPDFTTEIGGREVTQGTWITFREAIDSWRGLPDGALYDALTEERIRINMVPGRGMWATINVAGTRSPDEARANWSGRLSAIQSHYRQTYRLPQEWVDRTEDMLPILVATIDPTKGQRAPARVWADYCLVLSQKGQALSGAGDGENSWCTNHTSYPGRGKPPDKNLRPTPAEVQILDPEQGIVRAQFMPEPFGSVALVLPSLISDGAPSWDPRPRKGQNLGFGSIALGSDPAQLAADQKLMMIFTMVPAIALYPITVTAEEMGYPGARGPEKFIRLPAGVETARVGWTEGAKTAIEKAFGFETVPGDTPDVSALTPFVINDAPQSDLGTSAASLPNIARAAAAAVYAAEKARYEGSRTGPLRGDLVLAGALERLSHTVRPDGARVTMASLRGSLPVVDWLTYMDSGTRRIVQRRLK